MKPWVMAYTVQIMQPSDYPETQTLAVVTKPETTFRELNLFEMNVFIFEFQLYFLHAITVISKVE